MVATIQHSTAPPNDPEGRCSGHTLIELLVTISLLVLMVTLPLATLGRVFQGAEARSTAQAVQGTLAEAQVEALSLGGRHVVAVAPESWTLLRGASGALETVASGELTAPSLATNVERWLEGTGVRVAFAGWFASPDSAGSVFLGEEGVGSRVVVRAATGLTRRERR